MSNQRTLLDIGGPLSHREKLDFRPTKSVKMRYSFSYFFHTPASDKEHFFATLFPCRCPPESSMGDRIDTVTARGKLAARRDPYWQRISQGLFVGFRKMTSGTTGTWMIRYRSENRKQLQKSLGSLEQFPAFERFDRAVDAAKKLITHLHQGGSTETSTVMDACDAYTTKIRELKGSKAADDLDARYRRWVANDPVHRIELTKLTREHIHSFRNRMVAAPVKVGKSAITRARSKDTVNRDIAAIRAALNQALSDGKVTSDFAWRIPLAAFKNVTKRRELYLDRNQRKELIRMAPPDLAQFVKGLSMLPLRPGALAALLVADFDTKFEILKIGIDKSGAARKFKIPPEISQFLRECALNRPSTAPLLSRADGSAWNKDSWKHPLKAAAKDAGLPSNTVAYSLRHAAITDLVHGGLDLLTVAQISGTSVTMIEKYYGHLRGDVAARALAKLVL
jgi:integrase